MADSDEQALAQISDERKARLGKRVTTALIGSPETIRKLLVTYEEAGVQELLMRLSMGPTWRPFAASRKSSSRKEGHSSGNGARCSSTDEVEDYGINLSAVREVFLLPGQTCNHGAKFSIDLQRSAGRRTRSARVAQGVQLLVQCSESFWKDHPLLGIAAHCR